MFNFVSFTLVFTFFTFKLLQPIFKYHTIFYIEKNLLTVHFYFYPSYSLFRYFAFIFDVNLTNVFQEM